MVAGKILPFVTWVYVSKTVLRLVVDKPLRNLKMTGLYDRSYWIAVFIMDGLFIGMAQLSYAQHLLHLVCSTFRNLCITCWFWCILHNYYLASLNFSIFISTSLIMHNLPRKWQLLH